MDEMLNYNLVSKSFCRRIRLTDRHLEIFFNRLAFQPDNRGLNGMCFVDGVIPLRIEYDNQWDYTGKQIRRASDFIVIEESVVPEDVLRMRTEAFRKICEQNQGVVFNSSVYQMVTKGAAVSQHIATRPMNDTAKFPNYFAQFRNVTQQQPGEDDTAWEFRLFLNFRLMFQRIKELETKKLGEKI